jgi:hypothetical protein
VYRPCPPWQEEHGPVGCWVANGACAARRETGGSLSGHRPRNASSQCLRLSICGRFPYRCLLQAITTAWWWLSMGRPDEVRRALARNSHTGEGWSTAWGANRRGMARTDERMSVARVGSRMSNTASPAALLGCMLTVRCLVRVRWQHVAIAHERGRIRSARDRRMTSLP